MRMILKKTLCIVSIAILNSSQSQDVAKVESILDRLEERLLEQEGDPFSIKGAKMDELRTKSPEVTFSGQTIYAEGDDLSRIKDIGEAIGKLEQQVESLSARVHRSRQHVVDLARLSNHVAIEVKLPEGDAAALQYIAAFIDEFEVYRLEDAGGIWMPGKATPIYSGPMTPGSHKLRILARMSLRESNGIPVQTPLTRTIDQMFEVNVSSENAKQRLAIEITSPKTLDGKATAVLKAM